MMKTLYKTRLISIVALMVMALFALSFISCGKAKQPTDKYNFYENTVESGKPIAFGDDRDIYVFCDDANWKALNPALESGLQREVQLVVKEKYFNVIKADLGQIDDLIKYKNLLFVGDLQTKAAVSRHIVATLPANLKDKVKATGGELFLANNRWVNDQIVAYLVGKDPAGLSKISQIQGTNLYAAYVKKLGERLAYQVYQTKVIPPEFFASYPFSLKIPQNYKLFADDKKGRFLSFLYRTANENKESPDKYISIYYEDIPIQQLNEEWVKGVRKYIGLKYFEGDEFDPKSLNVEKIDIGKNQAWKISGAWKNLKYNIGGAFQSIAFYNVNQKRAYLIDNSVYFPSGDKLILLLELQKISATFETK